MILGIHPSAIFTFLQHLIDMREGVSGNGHSGFASSFRSASAVIRHPGRFFALIELEQILAGIVDDVPSVGVRGKAAGSV